MGYIMPVDRYQYVNYREREIEDRISITPVNPTFRTILERTHQEVSSEYDRQLASSYQAIPMQPQAGKVDKAYAEITGAGTRFNEKI